MARWHEDDAQLSRQCCASAVGGAQGNEWGEEGEDTRIRRETTVVESRKETADRVARHQAD